MWPVTTLFVLGAVTRAISQTPLFRAHTGYEADHCHRCLQIPENNDDILYLYNRVIVKSAGFHLYPWLNVLENRELSVEPLTFLDCLVACPSFRNFPQ